MTQITGVEEPGGQPLGIGDLARLTGVPVRTIRFYCDEGILASVRSAGGHRRFTSDTVDRLGLVRRLRGLGLGLPSITSVLAGERSVAEVVAAERSALDVELAALAWRRASLRAVEQASPVERAARLELLAAVQDSRAAQDTLLAFWRGLMHRPTAAVASIEMFLEASVPEPPTDPTPDQVVAYAEMVILVGNQSLRRLMHIRSRVNAEQVSDEGALINGLGEACLLAMPLVEAGQRPGPGAPLDRFVDAHAAVRGARDTMEFRRGLLTDLAPDRSSHLRRYWELVGDVTGEPCTFGEVHTWLLDALATATA